VFSNFLLYSKIHNGELLQVTSMGGNYSSFSYRGISISTAFLTCKIISILLAIIMAAQKLQLQNVKGKVVVEMVFGRLKAQWRRLCKKIDMHTVVLTYYNVCEIHLMNLTRLYGFRSAR